MLRLLDIITSALLIESMNGSKLEAQNPIITLLNHAKNVNSYPDSATPLHRYINHKLSPFPKSRITN